MWGLKIVGLVFVSWVVFGLVVRKVLGVGSLVFFVI